MPALERQSDEEVEVVHFASRLDASNALRVREELDLLVPQPATELRRQVENDIDLATEWVQIFLQDASEMSNDIAVAAQAGDAPALASAAHAYKGSAVAMVAVAVGRAAGALEAASRAGSTSVDREMAHFKELEVRALEQLSAGA